MAGEKVLKPENIEMLKSALPDIFDMKSVKLDWDEDLLETFYEYLDIHFVGDSIISPKVLLEDVRNNFGQSCAQVLQSIFVEVSLSHGLFMYDPDVEN